MTRHFGHPKRARIAKASIFRRPGDAQSQLAQLFDPAGHPYHKPALPMWLTVAILTLSAACLGLWGGIALAVWDVVP